MSTGLVYLLNFRLLALHTLHCLVSKILHSRDIYLHKLHSSQRKHGLPSHQEDSLDASWNNPVKEGSIPLYCPTRGVEQIKI